ncbi:MAG: ATP-binding protein [Gaiellaceae bacterium]
MRLGGGLVPRTLGASAVVAALVCASLAALLVAVSASRRSIARESHSKDVAVAIVTLAKVVADLDSGLHAYVATRSETTLRPWRNARAELTRAEARLRTLVAQDDVESLDVQVLQGSIASYVDDWSVPLIRIARIDPGAARAPVATLEDKRRTDEIRARLRRLLAIEDGRAAASTHAARTESHRAVVLGLSALGTSGALILLFGLYLATSIARPIRLAAGAASRVAAGDFSDRLPERGPGEIGMLTRAFNAMAGSLEQQRRELLEQNRRLEEAERQKSELISIVSHEVRTPLSSLLGFSDLLLRRDVDEAARRRYLEIIHTESRRLASLTGDFLDVRLLEEGRLSLALEQIDLAQIARDQAAMFLAQDEEHALVLDVPDRPIWIEGDHDRLSQVVGNLVANAVKYSPGGGEIAVRAGESEGKARLEVSDHGVGIPREDQALIFTKFYRGRAAASGIPGTGLGLAIARELVHAHGGEIEFESELGRGTTFRVELPVKAA